MKLKFVIFSCLLTSFLLFTKVEAQFFERPNFFRRGDELMEREIRNLQRRKPDPHPSFTISNPDSLENWQAFLFEEAKFSVWMPQGVFSQKTTNLEVASEVVEFEQFSADLPSEKFIVAYSNNLSLVQTENKENLLKQVRDGIIKRTKFRLTQESYLDLDKYLGKEIILANSSELITFRIYLIEDRLYVLGVSQSLESQNKQQKAIFLNSFRSLF